MYENISLRLFGKVLIPYLDYFDPLKENMKKGRMLYSLHEYLSMVVFSSFIAFAASLVFLTIFLSLLLPLAGYSYTLAIIISFLVGGMTFFFGYYYPSIKAKGIKGKIDKALPFAIFYMATTASSGTHPMNIFKMLTLRGGAIGEEASRIYTNVKTLGMDITSSLQKAASRSPSPQFAELLWGMMAIITTGGDMEEYLKGRTRTAMTHYRRRLNDYAKTISLYTEIYITLIIVGSIFFIILIAILSPLVGGNTLLLQTFIVFFFIPLVSIGFIMILKSASPTE
jgi:flagellar protein FlaJ